jgi:hypothetical protein
MSEEGLQIFRRKSGREERSSEKRQKPPHKRGFLPFWKNARAFDRFGEKLEKSEVI